MIASQHCDSSLKAYFFVSLLRFFFLVLYGVFSDEVDVLGGPFSAFQRGVRRGNRRRDFRERETSPGTLPWRFFRSRPAPAFTESPRQGGFKTARRNARRDAVENTLYDDDRASAAQRYAARSTSPLTFFAKQRHTI
jgi:hypothetical protein